MTVKRVEVAFGEEMRKQDEAEQAMEEEMGTIGGAGQGLYGCGCRR